MNARACSCDDDGCGGDCANSTLIEVDRNARAYGWEVGRGQALGAVVDASPENPFMDPRWRDGIKTD